MLLSAKRRVNCTSGNMARTYFVEIREQMPKLTYTYKQALITFNSSSKTVRDEISDIGNKYRGYLKKSRFDSSVVIYKVSPNRINGVQNMTLIGYLKINNTALMWTKIGSNGGHTMINLDEPAHKGVVRVYTN